MNPPTEPSRTPAGTNSACGTVLDRLPEHPFLDGLAPKHLQVLTRNAMRVRYQPGELIFQEGDPANRFYLIEQGKVSLESRRSGGPPRSVQVIGSGDVLGWSWLFPPYYWQFDARALEPTTAIFLYGTRLLEQCEQDHDFGFEMMKRMSRIIIDRLQSARRQLLSAAT